MVVGVCHITLLIHDKCSLKEKRKVLKGLLEKVRNRFNVSAAEVGSHDLWQRAEVGIAAVGGEEAFVNSTVDKVLNYIEGLHVAEVASHDIEFMHLGPGDPEWDPEDFR